MVLLAWSVMCATDSSGEGNAPVPMSFRILVKWSKHDGQDDFDVVAHEVAKVFVVPEVQCALGDLEMRASN